MRGQTELPALGVAFVLLTAALVLAIGAASMSFTTAERPALERQAAVSLSDQLVSEQAPLTARQNILREPAVAVFNESKLQAYELPDGAVAVELDGETIATRGEPSGGTTVERIVLVEERTEKTIQPEFEDSRTVTLPRRTFNTTVTIMPPAGTTVRSVRADGAVVLQNESGLAGTFELSLSSLETTTLRFEAAGPLPDNRVELSYEAAETSKATLAVTVDA